MAEDLIIKSGTSNLYKNDRGNSVLITAPVVAIVKNNIDPMHSGRLQVYVANYGGSDPDSSDNWIGVSYLSPWFGIVSPNNNPSSGPDTTGYGKYVGNPHSYGFWASAPDLGTEVICVFIDGNPNQGYYIGCIPKPGLHHMVPAVASGTNVVPNEEEAKTYGTASTRLPVTEVNYSNTAISQSPTIYTQPKPIHSYQAAVLATQGLIRDDVRGIISSSSQRETPSKVFGFSTPGGAIYSGGYTDQQIKQSLDVDPSKLQIIGRRGGHSLVMDDGTIDGQDQLVRLRTSAGHMIMMSDSGQTLFIMHSNGKSWIELGKEGTIDMFSTNSVNIRTKGDLNLHADRDININAKRNLHMYGENLKVEAAQSMTQRAGQNFEGYTGGKFTIKADGAMSMFSSGDSSYASSATTYINGATIKLNTGSTSTSPATVAVIKQNDYSDTVFSTAKSWITPGPVPVTSITSRLTTHFPYPEAGKGVDVTVDDVIPASDPTPTASVQAANTSAPPTPVTPVTQAAVTTVNATPPVTVAGKTVIPAATVASTIAQNKATVDSMSEKELQDAKIIPNTPGITFRQLEQAELIKPGAGALVDSRIAQGMPLNIAAPAGMWTGGHGVDSVESLTQNASAQIDVAATNMQLGATDLHTAGVLTGLEAATQITGVVNAAGLNGASTVTKYLANPAKISSISGLVPGITSAISSGNFASGLTDNIRFGTNSSSPLVQAVSQSILQNLSRQAFATAVSRIGTLSANKPNSLGGLGAGIVGAVPVLTQSVQQLSQANTAVQRAEAALAEARFSNKELQTNESMAAVQSAESALAQAQQKYEQIRKQVFANLGKSSLNIIGTAAVSGNTNLASILPFLGIGSKTTSNLPNILANRVTQQLKLPGTGIGARASNAIVGNVLQNLKRGSTGNIMSNLSSTLGGVAADYVANIKQQSGSTGKVIDMAAKIANINTSPTAIVNNVKKLLGSIGTSSTSSVPTSAVETYSGAAAITTKAAQLVGDNRVQPPVFNQIPVNITPNAYLLAQTGIKQDLTNLEALRTAQALELSSKMNLYTQHESSGLLTEISEAQQKLDQTDAKIVAAQSAYSALLSSK